MQTVLRFQWVGVAASTIQDQVRVGVTISTGGPSPGTLVDIILDAVTVEPSDEADVTNAMALLGWAFLAKNPPSLPSNP